MEAEAALVVLWEAEAEAVPDILAEWKMEIQ
jgi:hypothetical protein